MLTAALFVISAACGRDLPAAPEMDGLPPGAVGVVSVAPDQGAPIVAGKDHTSVFAFDAAGSLLGQVRGGAVDLSRVVSWRRGFTAATADSVITVTDADRRSVGIDENIVEGAVRDPRSGRSLFWFNTGSPGGGPYRNNYVLSDPDAEPHVGTIPGIILVAAHCGSRAYAVVADIQAIGGGPTVTHRLYEFPVDGGEPVLRGSWEYPQDFSSTSRAVVCSADGAAIYGLFGPPEARRSATGAPGLVLVRIDTATGSRTESPVDMGGRAAAARPGTLTSVNGRLYWMAWDDGTVLSLGLTGESRVRAEWNLPVRGYAHHVTVTDTTVAHLDAEADPPTYAEYDLLTGKRTRDPIRLSWLSSIVGSRTESGKNFYIVTGVAGLARSL